MVFKNVVYLVEVIVVEILTFSNISSFVWKRRFCEEIAILVLQLHKIFECLLRSLNCVTSVHVRFFEKKLFVNLRIQGKEKLIICKENENWDNNFANFFYFFLYVFI